MVVSTAAFQVTAASNMTCLGTPNPTDVVGAASTCFTNSSGMCVTDGPGAHGNNERCTIQIRRNGVLTVPNDANFSLENNFDYLLYNGTRYYTRASIEGLRVEAGTQMAFYSDGSITNQGFTVCVRNTVTTVLRPLKALSLSRTHTHTLYALFFYRKYSFCPFAPL